MAWLEVSITEDEITEDDEGRAKATMVFYVESDDPATTDAVLAADDGTVAIPARRESYSSSRPRCRVTDRRVERIDRNNPRQFKVTVQFADPTDGSDTATLLAKPIDVKSSAERQMEDYRYDAEDVPVCNKAGEPFDQSPQRPGHNRVFKCVKYVSATGKANLEAAELTNNASAKTIDGRSYPTDTLVLCPADFDEVEDEDGLGTGVYRAEYEIRYNKYKWIDRALNVGFTQILDGTRVDIQQRDASGKPVPVTRPWPLDSDGVQKPNPTDTPDELNFYPFPQHAWTGVPLT